jgi:phosphohistidine phosphatase
MNLYILRHASAGTRRANPLIDVKRPLDKEGKHHCLQLAYVLNTMRAQFDLVVSSPLKRSLQTASLVATETGYEAPILHSDALSPSATFKDFQKLLHDNAGKENILVVGHNPNLTTFLGAMLMPTSSAIVPSIRLRKGSLARITLLSATARGPATLQGLLDPRVVRALYATSTKRSRPRTSRK